MTKDQFSAIQPNTTLIVDIRETVELQTIPSPANAAHIPINEFVAQIKSGRFPRDKKIVTVCHSGNRCKIILPLLISQGYDADYLEGGVLEL